MLARVTVIACLLCAAPALAEDLDPEDVTPPGYDFCGWRDYERGGWAMRWEDRLAGASTTLFARRMTCRSARRNYARTSFAGGAPVRAGYRCVELARGYEFLDVRCSKRGRPRMAYRFQTGS